MLVPIMDYLRVSSPYEENNLRRIIERGQAYLNELAGVELDFSTEGLARALLFDYCRYAYNNATEYFLENYRDDLLRLQLMSAVEAGAVDA